jgi:C4-dicarboxylate-specific signal transduction histidine kinase/ActR/RegA family two-component response regulator
MSCSRKPEKGEMRGSALRKGLMGAALVVVAGSLFAGWVAVDGVRAENARDAQLAVLKEISTGIRRQGMDGLVAMVRDLAGRAPAEFRENSDTGRVFLARMEGEMGIAHADLGFLLDTGGLVRMRHQDPGETDLLGRDLSFRRYFRSGRRGREDLYGALGAFTARRGIYASAPVFRQEGFRGVVVARLSAEEIESVWFSGLHQPVALISPEGIVLASDVGAWRLASVAPQDSVLRRIRASRQYGDSLRPLGLDLGVPRVLWSGHAWSVLRTDLQGGWRLVGLLPRTARAPLSPSQKGAAWGLAAAWALLILLGVSVVTGLRRIGAVERERGHLARRLDEAERLESLGRLAGGVAHDFNNVLTAIIGYASVLEHRLVDRPGEKELAHRSGQAARRASETVRQLMAFARRSGLQVRPISLHDLVREVASLLEHTLPRGIRVVLDFQASRDILVGDASHLHQSLLNLAINSRDAMPDGGTLRFSTKDAQSAPDRGLELRISDTGKGISAEDLPHVFEPFFTTKSGGRGTGLGLASVWGTVQRHGGSISVASERGEGTVFIIHLALAPEGTEEERPPVDAASRLAGRGLRLLALDDDIHVLDAVAIMARSLGHHIEVHVNYQSLHDRLATGGVPDLLILDLDMPDISGLEVVHRLRSEHPGLPVMIASGHSTSSKLEEVRRLGVRVFLRKPFGASELDRALQETLREQGA